MTAAALPVLPPLSEKRWPELTKWVRWRFAALDYATRRAAPGTWVEAGVGEGHSTRRILRNLKADTVLHAFDSFKGLPNDWNDRFPAGYFACSPPDFGDERVRLHVGMFASTLPAFARSVDRVTFLHVDCDLYDSTITVLDALSPVLPIGAVVAFDEAFGTPAALEHEGRAIVDWQARSGRKLRALARTDYMQLVMEVVA